MQNGVSIDSSVAGQRQEDVGEEWDTLSTA